MATQVVLNETQHNATVDDVFTLTAKVMPEKAAQNVVWTMDKTNILQDLGNGKFKSLKAGEVTITATTQDESEVKAECRVVVKNPMATQVVLNKTQHNAIVDHIFTLTAKVMPEKATKNVVWTMDKTDILQNMGKGKFKALKAGEVTITATAQDGSGVKASCHVRVKNPMATQVVPNKTQHNAIVDDVFTLTAKVMPEKANQQLKWTLNNTDVLQHLGDGRFKALKAGEAIVTITTQDGSEVKAECHIKVERPTALRSQQDQTQHSVRWEGTTLVLQGVKSSALVRVFSLQGKILFEQIAHGTDLRIDLQGQDNILFVETTDGLRRKVVR